MLCLSVCLFFQRRKSAPVSLHKRPGHVRMCTGLSCLPSAGPDRTFSISICQRGTNRQPARGLGHAALVPTIARSTTTRVSDENIICYPDIDSPIANWGFCCGKKTKKITASIFLAEILSLQRNSSGLFLANSWPFVPSWRCPRVTKLRHGTQSYGPHRRVEMTAASVQRYHTNKVK